MTYEEWKKVTPEDKQLRAMYNYFIKWPRVLEPWYANDDEWWEAFAKRNQGNVSVVQPANTPPSQGGDYGFEPRR